MKCPVCGSPQDKVIDSRSSKNGEAIRRRRECLECKHRYTTYEYIESSLMVVKKDGRREPFDRQKILSGLKKACEKRPISVDQLEEVVRSIENELQAGGAVEVQATAVGELVMKSLSALDGVAYVRFASVYKSFREVSDFAEAVKDFSQKGDGKPAHKNAK
ncbi:MAG: transcriptional regulator NrdR [Candidatus Edwardsbacteria bacterium]|jgi:transcriptional repressor NrdR|nr:transcriptional regulator NrdR [Candidatus Edwardsbacteria bacterium]